MAVAGMSSRADAITGREIVPSPVDEYLQSLHAEVQDLSDGAVATYIPELSRADPSWFGIAVATVDGHVYEIGDTRVPFTMQSVSKPFVFGLALDDRGRDGVLARVGVEPSGNPFNSITVDPLTNRPFNPMVNAGAIVTTSLVASADQGGDHDDRMARVLQMFGRYIGHPVTIDDQVLGSEQATGDRNRAIAHLMKSLGMLDGDVDDALDRYFAQCSILVDCRDLALMAATLANGGVHPSTGSRAISREHVAQVLSVMSTCGMYDYAGEWVYRVGLPAKSGVSGGILAVLPGQLGIGVFSPPLDARGNSVRGVRVCERISGDFQLHVLRPQASVLSPIRRVSRGDQSRSTRVRTESEDSALARRGGVCAIYELQGDLTFPAMERVLRAVLDTLDTVELVVVDCKRVGTVDAAATTLLYELSSLLGASGRSLVLAQCPAIGEPKPAALHHFPDIDAALEWCEDLLLAAASHPPHPVVAFADHPLLRELRPSTVAALEAGTRIRHLQTGEHIFREGEPAESLFFLLAGSVSVHLGGDEGRRGHRLASFGAGCVVGETALLDDGPRSADVVADVPSVVSELPLDQLQKMEREAPDDASVFYRTLAADVARRLRGANAQIRALD